MEKKLFPFLMVYFILIFASCTQEQEDIIEEPEGLLSLTRSLDKESINVPCPIPRLKKMLDKGLGITEDSTLTAIFSDPNRVEYFVITGQKNKIMMEMRREGYMPQYTIYISDEYFTLTENGALFSVIHELFHVYRHTKNPNSDNDGDHEAMVSSFLYREWARKALGSPQHDYRMDYIVYCGTYESPVFWNLSNEKKYKVKLHCEEFGLPYN